MKFKDFLYLDNWLGILRNNIIFLITLILLYLTLEFFSFDNSISESFLIIFLTVFISFGIFVSILIHFKNKTTLEKDFFFFFLSFLAYNLILVFYFDILGLIMFLIFFSPSMIVSSILTFILHKEK